MMHFEAYFWPDWEHDVKIEEIAEGETSDSVWKEYEQTWDRRNELFRAQYAGPFSDSIGAKPVKLDHNRPDRGCRRFLCTGVHPQTRALLPLCAFLCPIIIPQELCRPAELMHCTL